MSLKCHLCSAALSDLLRGTTLCAKLLLTKFCDYKEVIVSDILYWDRLTVVFHFRVEFRARNLLDRIEKFKNWKRFQGLAPDLVYRRIQITSAVEANKGTGDFTTCTYRLSTNTITTIGTNRDLGGLGRRLKHKQRLRKLRYENQDQACKTAVNSIT